MATMRRFLCCSSIQNANVYEYDDEPIGHYMVVNYIWSNGLSFPNDRGVEDPNLPTFPALPANSYQWHEILDGILYFRQTYFLGGGDFGYVYGCYFSRTNEDAAVKIQDPTNPTGDYEFLAEVTTLHAANHQNVIKLLGKCYGRRNRAIVYEFMPNGSLDRHLFASNLTRVLDWGTRMKIAVGVAEGLIYTHQELKVVHRDVKVENILLDADFVPKLSDFGLATKIKVNENGVEQQNRIDLNLIKGTPGCMAPETEYQWMVSTKSDVYSYGVFLIVLFNGRKAFDSRRPIEKQTIIDWFREIYDRFDDYLPVDVALGNKYSPEGLSRLYQAVWLCINPGLGRPPMSEVETMVREAADFSVEVVTARHSV